MTPDVRPGAIVCTYIPTIQPPKDKLGLIAHIDVDRDSASLFLIHSELPVFVQSNEKLRKGVTKIRKDEHPFLDYDSWLRFGDVHAVQYSILVRQVGSSTGRCFCGYASNALMNQLLHLLPACPELSPRWQTRFCDSIRGTIELAGSNKVANQKGI